MTTKSNPFKIYLNGDIVFDPKKRMGGGGYGDLFKGHHLVDGVVALKRLRDQSSMASQKERDAFIDEAKLWRQLDHPNVLAFYGIHIHSWNEVYLVSPWVDNGSLTEFISDHADANRPALLGDAAEGLAYLHEHGIIHGDLKGANALVTSRLRVVLCDFGLSKMAETLNSETGGKGTTRWQSPELLLGGPRSFQADVYAFGITMYEVLSGRIPFAEYISTAVILAVVNRDERPPMQPRQSQDGNSYTEHWRIAENCWAGAADKRPTMSKVVARWPSSEIAQEERLLQLADDLISRYFKDQDASGIDDAIEVYRELLMLRPPGHPQRAASLANLGNALRERYTLQSNPSDIADVISLYREALQLHPPGDPDYATSVSNLELALRESYKRERSAETIEEALALNREAVQLHPPGHADRPAYLETLGKTLWERYRREGSLSDVEEAIYVYQEALENRPSDHPERAKSLNGLGNALWGRYKGKSDLSDIEEAIPLYREAIQLRPAGDINRPTSLDGLANALWERYKRGYNPSDLEEAITLYQESVRLHSRHAEYAEARRRLINLLRYQDPQKKERLLKKLKAGQV